jgi:hypothetical protein
MDNTNNKQVLATGNVTGSLMSGTVTFFRIEQPNEFAWLTQAMNDREANDRRKKSEIEKDVENWLSMPENKHLNDSSRFSKKTYAYYCKLSLTGTKFFAGTKEFVVPMVAGNSYSCGFKHKNYSFNLVETDREKNVITGHILVHEDKGNEVVALNIYQDNILYSVTLSPPMTTTTGAETMTVTANGTKMATAA